MKESPIFSRTYDLLRWLIPQTVKFPRQQRFVLAAGVQRTALQFQEELAHALAECKPGKTTADMMKHFPPEDIPEPPSGTAMHGLGLNEIMRSYQAGVANMNYQEIRKGLDERIETWPAYHGIGNKKRDLAIVRVACLSRNPLFRKVLKNSGT
jgi:hypothetical protein